MKFGIFDQLENPAGLDLSELYESRMTLVERAEEAGFWGFHKSEHHLIPLDHAPNSGLFLAALAQRTSTIRLCSLVHLLPFHHPIRLLEEICMLDHLSNGRFEFGFGKGVSPAEHALWGLDPEEAEARTDEMLSFLLGALQSDGDSFSFEGDFWQFTDLPIEVRPKQKPYPPLWRPGNVVTAAKFGVSSVAVGPISAVHETIDRYWQNHHEGIGGGHTPRIGAVRKFIVAPTESEAQAIGQRAWSAYSEHLTRLFRRFSLPVPNDPTIGGDFEMAKQVQAVVVGTPGQVREHVETLIANGKVDYVIGHFSFGDLSHDEALRSLDLFSEHVVVPCS